MPVFIPTKKTCCRYQRRYQAARARPGDPYSYPSRNSFDLKDTAFIKRNIEYDPKTNQYYIVEKIGTRYYRTPVSFSMKIGKAPGRKRWKRIFPERSSYGQYEPPVIQTQIQSIKRLVQPDHGRWSWWQSKNWHQANRLCGDAGRLYGAKYQEPDSSWKSTQARRFWFQYEFTTAGRCQNGEKRKCPLNYNTLANFNFENQLKLDFRGKDDDIIKQFQLGNTNFPKLKEPWFPARNHCSGSKHNYNLVNFG